MGRTALTPGSAADALLAQAALHLKQRRPLAALALLDGAGHASPRRALLSGVALTRLGRIDDACGQLLPLLGGPEPWATEACAALADAYHFAGRSAALRELLGQRAAWANTPRGQLFRARLLAGSDAGQALAVLQTIVDGADADLRRIAGFDAVRLLDRAGRYREAFDLATQLHATTPPFDVDAFVATSQQQQRLLAKGAAWCRPHAAPAAGVAFVVGLPRSGTTLLEQMLDGHPAVAGIGEHEGLGEMADALLSAGVWPYRLNHLGADVAAQLRHAYRASARAATARADAVWTLDKSLMTWRWLPAVAAILPGAVALHVQREPRDAAISAYLSYLDPVAFGWAADLGAIRQVIAAERALVPLALQTLGLAHETVVYERLVAEPRATLQRCVARLGLPMDDRVLTPERNPRTAMTLSHVQVRSPVSDASIGRWQNYAFAFDGNWPLRADR